MLAREHGEDALETLDRLLHAMRRRFRAIGGGFRTCGGVFGAVGGVVAGSRDARHERKHYEQCADEMADA